MQKLFHIVSEIFVEFSDSFADAIFERPRFVFNHFDNSVLLLSLSNFNILGFNYFLKSFWIQSEHFAEYISTPLNTMDCLFREHFQCAVRNLCFL